MEKWDDNGAALNLKTIFTRTSVSLSQKHNFHLNLNSPVQHVSQYLNLPLPLVRLKSFEAAYLNQVPPNLQMCFLRAVLSKPEISRLNGFNNELRVVLAIRSALNKLRYAFLQLQCKESHSQGRTPVFMRELYTT